MLQKKVRSHRWTHPSISKKEVIDLIRSELYVYGPMISSQIVKMVRHEFPELDSLEIRGLLCLPQFELGNAGWQIPKQFN